MSKSTWSATDLYQALTGRKGPAVAAVVNLLDRPPVMPAIELILDFGGTTPKDFTLHDSGHSFRVAQRMWQLIPEETKEILSAYELGLLLLSAYLHDIGMSPEYEKVQRHRIFLTEKKSQILSEEEIEEFQKWIDDDPQVGDFDVRIELITDAQQVNYILAHYIRHKHNDWSGDWIKKNLSNEKLMHYPWWVDDLILVCKSHHYGIKHLLEEAFDPRPITADAIVHLRYIAMCLRVADVMENDPERTPEVLLNHRQISPDSLKYWLKDHPFRLLDQDHTYTVYARPLKAFIHKAIEETAGQIESELRLCDELVRRKPLTHSPAMKLDGYSWNIVPFVKLDIRPEKNAYEYIHGAFKPNTAKILELLGGHQLYGDAIWAFRELLQNAFDAVKEQIAWEVINRDLDPKVALVKLGKVLAIDISLVERADGKWLICKDEGVGMTKGIIEKYFLQSGVSKRHEIKELERECRKRNFHLGRTGQFGIGALSYFMLADKIIIRTQRALNTGYHASESIGWQFEISGTHDFGELTRSEFPGGGTEVQLKLNAAVADEIAAWDNKFDLFIYENVLRSPCVLSYTAISEDQFWIFPGWAKDSEAIRNKILKLAENSLFREDWVDGHPNPSTVTSYEREQREQELVYGEELVKEICEKLAFLSGEGEIDDGISYRICIPYFKLMYGNSYFFLKERMEGERHYLTTFSNGHYWLPDFHPRESFGLKGIQVKIPALDHLTSTVYIELDFESIDESNLSVTRKEIVLKEGFSARLREAIEEKIGHLFKANEALFDNRYALLNSEHTGLLPKQFYWAFEEEPGRENQDLIWREIDYPALVVSDESAVFARDLYFRKEPVCIVYKALKLFTRRDYLGVSPFQFSHQLKFDYRLGLLRENWHTPYAVIMRKPVSGENFQEIEFPAAWNKLLLIRSNKEGINRTLNKNHPLAILYDPAREGLFEPVYHYSNTDESDNLFPDTTSKSACLSFLVFAAHTYIRNIWIAICEQNPQIIKAVFFRLGIDEIFFIHNSDLCVMSFGAYDIYTTDEDIEKFLPRIAEDDFYFTAMPDGNPPGFSW